MGTNTLTGQNIEFPIYKADGSSFYGLVLRKATFDSIVMSLGDKITGDVVYSNNALPVSMGEYIMFAGVKYTLVNPPTVVREGFAKDNSDLKGMTRYSFEFYHPMYQLGNLPFSDVAVSSDEQRYLSENKVFNWIGKPDDYIAKLNKNLENTQWVIVKSVHFPIEKLDVLSEVLSFDKATIADALKTWYDTWKVPFIVDVIKETDPLYAQGKRFSVIVGFPAEEILDTNGNPYVFKMGQGVGLKNNSRTPKNNKIVTRISPYGSERNIPYGYPQIVWTGNQDWEYTIDNNPTAANSYPIYDGIVGGQNVRLIKHPFTRKTLMPSIYATLVNKKVNPNATGYDPNIELVDYYDATSEEGYPNPINPLAPSYEAHEFGDIYPRLDEKSILGAEPYDTLEEQGVDGYLNESEFLGTVLNNCTSTKNAGERAALLGLYNALNNGVVSYHSESQSGDDYQFVCDVTSDADFYYVKYTSSNINYDVVLLKTGHSVPVASSWNDKMDDDGNYIQSYFKITLPVLNFDMYACASITEEMKIHMRSGACIGCTFNVAVDWDDYKRNFYDENGNFAPNGSQRDLAKYPKTNDGSVTLIVQKDNETFGTLMPNIYQQPKSGDKFVVLGISLPTSYIADAEQELDEAAKQYMLENNVYYYEYPLKFDEYFLAKNTHILNQIKPNSIVRFKYNGEQDNIVLYVKQITIKYGQGVLPQYDITITDDIEVVLNKIGQVTDDVSRLRLDLSQLMQYYNGDTSALEGLQLLLADKLSKVSDDTAQGFINFLQGIQVGERFVSGILGEGGVFRRNADGKVYLETDNLYVRMKAYFDTVEVRHYKHSSGNRIASNAGIHCSRVSWIDANGNQTEDINTAVKFRCFFRATDGDDTVENYFMADSNGRQDLAFCDKTSLSSGISKRRYWRAVVGKNAVLTDDGEAWIDLSKSDCESGSDIPMAGDDIIQLGNRTDSERQGAIIEYVNGNDAPSYHIYQFINDFNLSNKNIIRIGFNSRTGRAEMNVYGDAYIGDPNGSTYIKYNQATKKVEINAEVNIGSTFGGQTLDEYIQDHTWTQQQIESLFADDFDDIDTAIENIQKQVDGSIETWFYDGLPTSSNLPESQWTTTDDKKNHLGDLYYDNITGYAYRYSNTGTEQNPRFEWKKISDQDVTKALSDAAKAQYTADHKMKVFVRQPLDSEDYQVGDLWVNATVGEYVNETLRCNTSKEAGSPFNLSHWEKSSRYIGQSEVNQSLNNFTTTVLNPAIGGVQTQIDGKIETYYQNSQPTWDSDDNSKHVGDLWYNTDTKELKRFDSSYNWQIIQDKDAIQAIGAAANAQSTADGKMTVFVDTPQPPYQIGDLWVQGVSGDIMRCKTPRETGASYSSSDWEKASKYTDDSYVQLWINNEYATDKANIKSQIDKKAETWYQPTNPATTTQGWVNAEHIGDLWYNTTNQKTYYYDNATTTDGYEGWKQQSVPTEVFNAIDGKSSIFISQPSNYKKNDLWILDDDTEVNGVSYKKGEVLTASNNSATYVQSHWSKKVRYTDDSSLEAFMDGEFKTFEKTVKAQIDQKVETWYQPQNPADDQGWVANEHVGDLWYNTNLKKTYIYEDKGASTNPRYEWGDTQTTVPQEVFDKIDGKAQIFVTRPTPPYNVGDLWVQGKNGEILKCITKRTSGSYSDDDWTWASKYTDDSKFNGYINQVLNGTGATGDTATVANAIRVIKGALNEATVIDRGLVLTSLINLRSNNKTWAGISGIYDESVQGGGIAAWYGGVMVDHEVNTTATDYAKSLFRFDGSGYLASGNISWNKDGNATYKGAFEAISSSNGGWKINPYTNIIAIPSIEGVDKYGTTVFKLMFDADTEKGSWPRDYGGLYISNSGNFNYPDAEYAREAWLISYRTNTNIYMTAYVGEQYPYIHGVSANNKDFYIGVDSNGLRLQSNLWKTKSSASNNQVFVDDYGLVRVKGVNDSFVPQGSSQVSGTVTSVGLSAPTGFSVSGSPVTTSGTIALSFSSGYSLPTTAKQNNWDTAYGWGNHANAGYLTSNSLSGYATQSWVTSQGYTTNIGTVTQVKVGTAAYNPSSGVVSLPAYPTTLPASDVYSWAKASTKPSYAWSEIGSKPSEFAPSAGSTYYLEWKGDAGKGNMNDIARSWKSSTGMTSLSSSSVDNGDMSGWTHFISTSYSDGGAGSNSWVFQLACPAGSSNLQFRSRNGGTINNGTAWNTGWTKILHAGNSSVSGQTITINGVSTTWQNTWRGIQNNLTSSSTTDSLSAYQGKLLASGSARDSTKLPLTGGTLTGGLVVNSNILGYTIQSDGIITAGGDVTAASFKKRGGTSSQFLKADGSVDSNAYITSAALSGYINPTITNLANGDILIYDSAGSFVNVPYTNLLSGYLPRSGGIMTGSVNFSSPAYGINFSNGSQGSGDVSWSSEYAGVSLRSSTKIVLDSNTIWAEGNLSAYSFIKYGGTSTQFLKADGSVTTLKTINGNSLEGSGDIVISGGGGTLYDAEIEYLGISYCLVHLPFYPSTNYKYYWKVSFNTISDYNYLFNSNGSIGDWFIFGGTEYNRHPQLHIGSNANVSQTVLQTNTLYECSLTRQSGSLVLKYNGTTSNSLTYVNFTSSKKLDIIGVDCNFYYLKVYDGNDNLIYDFIPVRVGQVGYLYDKVSGQLFGNEGSGSFVLGQDTGPGGGSGSYLPLTGGTITGNLTVYGNVGIGTTSPSYKLHVDGQVGATGFANTSDLRKKTITGDVPMNLYNVSNAPLFKFTWNDEKKYSGQHIGSAAQYWQTILPELVSVGRDADMTLAMQYDVIALASAITVAKTVVNHEERIKILENENKSLKEEIELLKNKS